MEKFDGYYKWLGIPPEEQPADFYRLLGLKRYEENREVISNAADQRMAHIRSFQTGPHGKESQRVLNELAKAAGCLLNPRRKAMYDQHLRSAEIAANQEKALVPPTEQSEDDLRIQIETPRAAGNPPPRKRPIPTRTRGILVWFAIGTVASVAIVTTAIVIIARNKPPNVPASLGSQVAASEKPPASTSGLDAQVTNAGLDQGVEQTVIKPVAAITSKVSDTGGSDKTKSSEPSPATASVGGNNADSKHTGSGTGNPASPVSPSSDSALAANSEPALPPIVAGKPRALHFRRNDRVEISNTVGLIDPRKPYTVEMWVRFAPAENAHWLCGDLIIGPHHPGVASQSIVGWQLFIQQTMEGRHRVAVSTRDGYASDFLVEVNAWHHIAAVNDTNEVIIFVDGKPTAKGAAELLVRSYAPSPIPLHIGSHPYMDAKQAPGLLGDLRAFRVSSAVRYTALFSPPSSFEKDPATELLFDFDNATDQKLADISGHNRDGAIQGARWFGVDAMPTPAAVASVGTPATSPKPASSPPAIEAKPAVSPTLVREPVPDQDAVAKAREQVRLVFGKETEKAKEPKELLALADKLMALAAESQDNPASRYVMIEEAHKLAAQSGDLNKALTLIDDMARRFEIEAPTVKASAVDAVVSAAKTTSDRRRLAELALGVADELIVAGRFDRAAEIVQTSITQSGRIKDIDLTKAARELREEIVAAKKAFGAAQIAHEQLASQPDDGDLNLRWGRFLCFHQRNWEQGRPFLVKGSNQALSSVAKLDLANPTEATGQAEVGRAWAGCVKGVESSEKNGVSLRALYWSRQAEPLLKGLARAEIEKRIKDLETALPPRYRTMASKGPKASATAQAFQPPREFIGLLGRIQSTGTDAGVLWKYEAGLNLSNQSITDVLSQAKVARGKMRMEFVGLLYVPESTTVNVAHRGGSATGSLALFVNNKQLGEVGGTRATSDVYKIELNAGEHEIRWVLTGDDVGNSSLVFTNSATAQSLPVYHNPQLLNFVRESPSRARLNVNMLRN